MKMQFNKRRLSFFAGIIVLALVSCKKEKQPMATPDIPNTVMEYFDLNNQEIKAGAPGFSIDVDHDNRNDLAFSTQLVGDPINQVDKLQFLAGSNIKVNFAVNSNEAVPVMEAGDLIPLQNFDGYEWFELSSIVLVQKISSLTQPAFWEGHWKNASHRYLPYQVVKGDKLYNGWVELSVDTINEKLLLHRAAISKEAGKAVKAGN
ncbi:hypothetical protein [Ferruginibacter sp.]